MSGGRLVVLDRLGREVKRFPLPSGLATLGSHPRCDIRVMLPAVAAHHATVVVHQNQTVVRNVGSGETLVNGRPVSVAALRHGDLITVGDRSLRWDYDDAQATRPLEPQPALYSGSRGRKVRGRARASAEAGANARSPSLQLALELQHRASMPGGAGGKQVAIVQPQRRDTTEQNDASSPRNNPTPKRQRSTLADETPSRSSPKGLTATKASMWIESRKAPPRKAANVTTPPAPRRSFKAATARKATPLRLAVLRRTASMTKVQPPTQLDQTKQVAIMLMTGHTPKLKISPKSRRTPSFVVKKPSPVATPRGRKSGNNSLAATPRQKSMNESVTSPRRQKTLDNNSITSQKGRRTLNESADVSPRKRKSLNESPKVSPTRQKTLNESSILSPRGRKTNENFIISPKGRNTSSERSSPRKKTMNESSITSPRGQKTLDISIVSSKGNKTLNDGTILSPRGRETINESFTISPTRQKTVNESLVSLRGRKTLNDTSIVSLENNSTILSPRKRQTLNRSSMSKGQKSLNNTSIVSTRGSRSADSSPVVSPRGRKTLDNTASVGDVSRRSRKSTRSSAGESVYILEISDSTRPSPRIRSSRSQPSPVRSPLLPSPKKSAMKDPKSTKPSRKTESIKFDLSNLESHTEDSNQDSLSEDDLTLHYETSSVQSPSPRRSIHSRSSKILEKTLGTTINESQPRSSRSTLTPQTQSPARKSSRGSIIIQKALDNESRSSRRSTKTLTDQSYDTTVASAFRTKTLSPRSPQNNLETYSIVDLVSLDSNESGRSTSIYNSAGSANSSAIAFGTPNNSSGRKTRSTIDPVLVQSSTPYVGKTKKSLTRSRSSPNISRQSSIRGNVSQNSSRSSVSTRRSKSMTTPENTQKHITVDSTRISRGSRSRSRISESELLLISDNSYVEDESPRSSKKSRSTKSSPQQRKSSNKPSSAEKRKSTRKTVDVTPRTQDEGLSTPENRHSPEEVGTPMLSIQSLLDSSQSSLASQNSNKKTRNKVSVNLKRKTIGAIRSEPRNRRTGLKSRSMNFIARRGILRLSDDSDKKGEDEEKMVTPKSAVKLVQEAVKNKHSTAKKPQSKRSIIDDLNESDIVKQLFNSPVKRKLSQSMTEFSRKQLFDDEEIATVRRPTRNTIALIGRTPDNSISEQTEVYTPERFVSPIATPSQSPDLTGIDRLFKKNTPKNDLTNVKGVKSLLRTPRTRKSVKNDLTNVSGVKKVFAKSPKNRLSDVRIKELFVAEPNNDLRKVSGVKTLFRSQRKNKSPKNDLTDVRGVKLLFQKNTPANDLRRVSGVKRTLQKHSPRNDLRDVRGVKRMFGEEKRRDDLNDVSGVEELFNVSNASKDTDILFDQLLGRPPIKAKYSKSFLKKPAPKPKTRKAKSLHVSIDEITSNVEEWLEKELEKRLHKDKDDKINRELQKLATETVEGVSPIIDSRIRRSVATNNSRRSASEIYIAHTLPIKKRSLIEKEPNLSDLQKSDSVRISLRVSNSLPLKKRVLHSTPLKGKRPTAPLARVSPIPPAASHDTSIRSDKQPKELPDLSKSRRTTQAKTETEQPSPKQTRANITKDTSLPKTRASKTNKSNTTQNKGRKNRPSLVIAKKSPVMSPKPTRARRGAQTKETVAKNTVQIEKEIVKVPTESAPKKTRGSKQVVVEINVVASPKKTRGRKQAETKEVTPKASPKRTGRKQPVTKQVTPKASPKTRKRTEPKQVTPKESPKKLSGRKQPAREEVKESPKPKAIHKQKETVPKESPKKTRTTRKTETEKPHESPKKTRTRKAATEKPQESSPKKTRTRKTETEKLKDSPKKSRTKKVEAATPKAVTPKKTRAKVQKNVVVISKPSPQIKPQKQETVTRNSRKTTANLTNDSIRDTKRRKVESPKAKTRKTEPKEIEIAPKRGRKNQTVEEKSAEKAESRKTRTRNVQTQDSTQSEPTSKRRKNEPENNTVIPEVKSRKRKTTAEEVLPKKMAKNNSGSEVATAKKTTRGRKTTEVEETQKESNTRQKRGAVRESKTEEVKAPPTRGKKASAAVDPAPKTNTRKRKTEASPFKAEPQKPRSTRARVAAVSPKPTGRSRRR